MAKEEDHKKELMIPDICLNMLENGLYTVDGHNVKELEKLFRLDYTPKNKNGPSLQSVLGLSKRSLHGGAKYDNEIINLDIDGGSEPNDCVEDEAGI